MINDDAFWSDANTIEQINNLTEKRLPLPVPLSLPLPPPLPPLPPSLPDTLVAPSIPLPHRGAWTLSSLVAARKRPSIGAADDTRAAKRQTTTDRRSERIAVTLLSERRFALVFGFDAAVIDVCRRCGGRYDTDEKQWTFAVECHRDLVDALTALKSTPSHRHIIIDDMPRAVVECLRQTPVEVAISDDDIRQHLPPPMRAAILPFQIAGIKFALSKRGRALLADEMGLGKCWAGGTLLMRYNGESVAVEHIQANDRLMGDDSTVRIVQANSVISQRGDLYEITSNNAGHDTWRCNLDHILVLRCNARPWHEQSHGVWRVLMWSLRRVRPGSSVLKYNTLPHTFRDSNSAKAYADSVNWRPLEFECSLRDFLTMAPGRRALCTMFQPKWVKFPQRGESLRSRLTRIVGRAVTHDEVIHTSWMLGVWLADGDAAGANVYRMTSCQQDPAHAHTDLVNHIRLWYTRINGAQTQVKMSADRVSSGNIIWKVNLNENVDKRRVRSRFLQLLVELKLINNKHFPLPLLTESRAVRYALLAGVIDGDARFCYQQKCYEISAKLPRFTGGLIHLCRGLGFTVGGTAPHNGSLRIAVSGNDLSDLAPYIQLTYKQCTNNGRDLHQDQSCAGFTITRVAQPETYYGFTLSGNGRCLLGRLPSYSQHRSSNSAERLISVRLARSRRRAVVFAVCLGERGASLVRRRR